MWWGSVMLEPYFAQVVQEEIRAVKLAVTLFLVLCVPGDLVRGLHLVLWTLARGTPGDQVQAESLWQRWAARTSRQHLMSLYDCKMSCSSGSSMAVLPQFAGTYMPHRSSCCWAGCSASVGLPSSKQKGRRHSAPCPKFSSQCLSSTAARERCPVRQDINCPTCVPEVTLSAPG
ncbi:hypothetical protein HPB50_025599 [Hyalomma asiaticum]|uniref:Uncharacterized protein n=1 Tax=Hyalomma asiaticum TaxID=266040 RepID=A0ACB7TBJ7_HYAAI|nr:hypothetical protein HPB50_025599 [Hyalomma asiaticum]